MSADTCQPVSVSRTIEAPAEALFAFLAQPSNHPLIDGSGMLRHASPQTITGAGDVFTMAMHNDEMGDYVMANHVVVYEPGRRIAWQPVLHAASRPEDIAEVGKSACHVWGYELTPLGPCSTLVTETHDCSRSPQWLRTATKDGTTWLGGMTATLARLGELSL